MIVDNYMNCNGFMTYYNLCNTESILLIQYISIVQDFNEL